MKFYEFIDKEPKLGSLVIVEGTERVLADRALDVILERLLPAGVRDLNLERVASSEWSDAGRISEALQAMPFLAERRVVVVTDAQILKAQPRRDLLEVAQNTPSGNTLVILDLLAPRSQRPQTIGALAGRAAVRIDTTATEETRARYINELLAQLGATAEPRVIGELTRSDADLASVRNDLEKLALDGKKIVYKNLANESLSVADPKAYRYASALIEGKIAEAFEIAHEFFGNDRGAAIPLLNALATECGFIWELARPGGELPARAKWRERVLRPLAARIGERRARIAYERAVRGIEAVVTGQAGSGPDDHRTLVERITAELSALSRR
ncbi:MAG: DNA polymerase III subunit delta [Candidatus Baltobacteraceae bacterium]